MTSLLQNHPFCRFFDQVNQQAEEALSVLKNRHDLNSNLLLFCYWFAANNQGLLSKAHIKQLLAAIYAWHQKIVSPLDALCNQLTESVDLDLWTLEDSAFENAAETRQTAEQIEQFLIADLLPKKPRRRGRSFLAQTTTHACLNVATYCQAIYVSLDESDYQCLAHVSTAVFPEMDAVKALSFIRKTLSGRQSKEPLQRDLLVV